MWSRELDDKWPVICTVAAMLMDGCTDVGAITAAVETADRMLTQQLAV